MADGNAGTASAVVQAPATDSASTEPAAGTGTQPDEVTTLRSRNAGLDAKVTELTKAREAAEKQAADAAAKLADYEAGKVQGDEALRAQLQAKEAELNAARQEAALARIQAAYPETYAVLGEDAANLSAEKLAEAEARFKGVDSTGEPPKPIGNNPSRTQGGASGAPNRAERTVKDIEAELRAMTPPWQAGG